MGSRDAPGRLGPLWTFLFRYGPPRWTEYVLKNWSGQRLVIAVPYLWLLVFFLVPFLIVLKISFAEYSPLGRPPYEPVFQLARTRARCRSSCWSAATCTCSTSRCT